MLVRLGLRAAVNLAAGIGVGLLAVAAIGACRCRRRDDATAAGAQDTSRHR